MHRNNPVISTAKIRGLIKKNKIRYVDAIGRLNPSHQLGISVWQLCDRIYFSAYGRSRQKWEDEVFAEFVDVLTSQGLTYKQQGNDIFEIVKAN